MRDEYSHWIYKRSQLYPARQSIRSNYTRYTARVHMYKSLPPFELLNFRSDIVTRYADYRKNI